MSQLDCSNKSRDECFALAKIAESAERYEDMCKAMKAVVDKKLKTWEANGSDISSEILHTEERNLLSVAYKNVVGTKRSAWRTLKSLADTGEDMATAQEFKARVEDELKSTCDEVIELLKDLCEKTKDKKDETTVFYYKMQGDYFRYLSEFKADEEFKNKCQEAYKTAMDVAEGALPETHPTRLGLALNFSVCYYEILSKPDEACKLAKKAFDAAIEKLDTLNDSSYKDSTLIMQLLRDNLTLWTSEKAEEEQDKA